MRDPEKTSTDALHVEYNRLNDRLDERSGKPVADGGRLIKRLGDVSAELNARHVFDCLSD